MANGSRVAVEVDGRRLALSNLTKVLYPETGFSKGEVIDYYTRIAPLILPHVAGRPVSFKRYPDGVAGPGFYAKNAPPGTPDWVRTVRLPSPGSSLDRETIDYVVVDDRATLVWVANLAALEVHVPQWSVGPRGATRPADLVVLDLDPGAPASVVECARVALLLRETLAGDGLQAWPKTSGSKGMQLHIPVRAVSSERTTAYARSLARRLERAHPDLVLSQMARHLRPGKVFIDWSQNDAAKTTVAAYSLRARPRPTVSTPVSWEEVEACRRLEDLSFTAPDVLERAERLGDLHADLVRVRQPLPPEAQEDRR